MQAITQVPLAYNNMGKAEVDAAMRVLASGYVTQGKEVEAFEASFAALHGAKHAILVNSGSSANLIALEALVYLSQLRPELTKGVIAPGDEVVIQGLNWPSTLKPLANHQLTPVFCDVNVESLNADVACLEAVVSEKTRVVVAVPVLGNPSGLDEIAAYCERKGIVLFEDACESLGAVTESGRKVGTLGIASAFSFYFSHHITTIEGGAILTDCSELADLCYALRSHGWTRHLRLGTGLFASDVADIDPRFCFVLPGYNVRSTEVNAAIGSVQLKRFPALLEARRRVAMGRAQALNSSNELSIPGCDLIDRHSWMTTPLLFRDRAHRLRGRASLESAGIETRPIIVGNTLRHPLIRSLAMSPRQPALPVCDEVFDRGLMIGLNPESTAETEAHVHRALQAAASA
jgi:CDP-6-deoxy-D-xylo-4-hexulose-3-dehydrase